MSHSKIHFDRIRYANCWEDTDILLEGLSAKPGSRILSIGSGGDNSLALLSTNPELVVAADVNENQLHLIELKKACIKLLEREETLSFLGFQLSNSRASTYQKLKAKLPTESQSYWIKHFSWIEKGVVHQGKFEKYFQTFSRKVVPLIHAKSVVKGLFEAKSEEEQSQFYQKCWNTFRWRMFFKIFFSKAVMGRLGRHPSLMKEVKVPVAQFIFNRAERHLSTARAQSNYILYYGLNGNFGDHLPFYLKEGNYEKIRENIDRLVLKQGWVQDIAPEFQPFHYMNLSNIFEYMDENQFAEITPQLMSTLKPGGKVAYWNLMVARRLSEHFPRLLKYCKDESESLTEKDKGFFYLQFNLDQKL